MLDPNALVFTFGAISTAAIALVFAFKWWGGDRQAYDRDWAVAHFLFAGAAAAAALQYVLPGDWLGLASVSMFWGFAALMINANLAFTGQPILRLPLLGLCGVLAISSVGFGLYKVNSGFVLFSTVLAAIYFWTGLIFRDLPRVGIVVAAIFAVRAGLVLFRPYLADSPHVFAYSTASFTANFLAGAALMAGSLLRSRSTMLASKRRLTNTNAELTAREGDLQHSYRLLEEQARRLERLGADYARALEQAEHANRAKDSFIANMNHEFRTPLNAVLGFSELIRAAAERQGATDIKEYADYVYEGGRTMLRNVNRILEFVALDSGARQASKAPFDPREATRAEITALSEMARGKHLHIVTQLDQSPEAWPGDERAFRTVIDELLRNALTAAPEASTVTVEVSGEPNELTLQIADSGPGLPDDFLKTIGERFNIRENVLHRGGLMQGVGLGLCIAGRYARLMGGTLSLNRNRPVGTVARLVIVAA